MTRRGSRMWRMNRRPSVLPGANETAHTRSTSETNHSISSSSGADIGPSTPP